MIKYILEGVRKAPCMTYTKNTWAKQWKTRRYKLNKGRTDLARWAGKKRKITSFYPPHSPFNFKYYFAACQAWISDFRFCSRHFILKSSPLFFPPPHLVASTVISLLLGFIFFFPYNHFLMVRMDIIPSFPSLVQPLACTCNNPQQKLSLHFKQTTFFALHSSYL